MEKVNLSSLSVPDLEDLKMFGIKLNKGLLKDMYKQGYKSEIELINEQFERMEDDINIIYIGQKDLPVKDKYTQEDKDNLEKIYPKFNENQLGWII